MWWQPVGDENIPYDSNEVSKTLLDKRAGTHPIVPNNFFNIYVILHECCVKSRSPLSARQDTLNN